ncbi:MAG: hypothetical protein IT437_05630 [Phycisphaerales bacterium]|nr:hypothetical protein [Phycisphaerales bacterium]
MTMQTPPQPPPELPGAPRIAVRTLRLLQFSLVGGILVYMALVLLVVGRRRAPG